MKKLLLLLACLIVGPTVAQSNKDTERLQVVKIDAYCMSEDTMSEITEKYQERPLLAMKSAREVSGKSLEFITILFANSKTSSWTLVEQVTENVYCVVATGDKLMPYSKVESGNKKQKSDIPGKSSVL